MTEEKTMNDKSNKALLKLELSVWVKKRAKKLKCSEKEIREYLAIEVMGCNNVMSIQNLMYGQVFPAKPDHALLLSIATGINVRVFNPDHDKLILKAYKKRKPK